MFARLAFLVFLIPLFACSVVHSQESTKAADIVSAEVRLSDGSVIRVTPIQDSIEVTTKFGKLTIPFTEIRRIEFGFHVPPNRQKDIEQNILLLASETYKDREAAFRELLTIGHWAYPALRKASHSADAELAARASLLVRKIAETTSAKLLRVKDHDTIHTIDFTFTGSISSESVKVRSSTFGDVSLRLADIVSMHVWKNREEATVIVDATKYGVSFDRWMDSGISVGSNRQLKIIAEGSVDLWPQTPGMYVACPKGRFGTTGRDGLFLAGTLIGRIGDAGKPFAIGDNYGVIPEDEGKLYILVTPTPWNNTPSGAYRVHIKMER